jgi:hypothetical protein
MRSGIRRSSSASRVIWLTAVLLALYLCGCGNNQITDNQAATPAPTRTPTPGP